MTSYISTALQSTTTTIGRWTGISDFKIAAGHFMNHHYKAFAIHTLVGAAKAAMVFGMFYVAIQKYSNSTSRAQEQSLMKEAFSCDKLLQTGFNGFAYCLSFGKGYDPKWFDVNVPGLDPSKYFIDDSALNYCWVRLTEAGMKLFSLRTNCTDLCFIRSKDLSLYGVCPTYK